MQAKSPVHKPPASLLSLCPEALLPRLVPLTSEFCVQFPVYRFVATPSTSTLPWSAYRLLLLRSFPYIVGFLQAPLPESKFTAIA